VKLIIASGKKDSDIVWVNTFSLIIGQVDPKIAPKENTPRFMNTQDIVGYIGFFLIIQDRLYITKVKIGAKITISNTPFMTGRFSAHVV
jgi:hypothetical protein